MTTEAKHTPEPWMTVVSQSGNRFTADIENISPARVMACVNACAGIPREQLEAGSVRRLVNKVGGAWRAFEMELRQDLGNTNYQIVADALAPLQKDSKS